MWREAVPGDGPAPGGEATRHNGPTPAGDPVPLPPVRREHLDRLAVLGPIAQFARGTVPDPAYGTCTDDVARALEVDLLHAATIGWDAVEHAAWANLRYLDEAVDADSGRFRNVRDVDGRWLERIGSEDAHGRAVLALGRAIAMAPEREFREAAAGVFRRALPATVGLTAIRARSSAMIGCTLACSGGNGTGAPEAWLAVGARLADGLAADFAPVASSASWPWPEPVVTYEAALMPRALIAGGPWPRDPRAVETGLAVLDWLTRSATTPAGHLSPVGNAGWWPRGGPRARFEQQPIEAAAFVFAAEAAFDATGDPRHVEDAERAFGWFLGANDGQIMIVDPSRGACHDGLGPRGRNENQGGESTLAWLAAVERMRVLRGRWPALGGDATLAEAARPVSGRRYGAGQLRT